MRKWLGAWSFDNGRGLAGQERSANSTTCISTESFPNCRNPVQTGYVDGNGFTARHTTLPPTLLVPSSTMSCSRSSTGTREHACTPTSTPREGYTLGRGRDKQGKQMDAEKECVSARANRGIRQISNGYFRHVTKQKRETAKSEDADARLH